MTSLLDTSQEEKAVQIQDDCESFGEEQQEKNKFMKKVLIASVVLNIIFLLSIIIMLVHYFQMDQYHE